MAHTYYKKETKFKNILVAIDGSDQSFKAAEYAVDIARDNKAHLIGLTVLDISQIGYAASAFITSPMFGLEELERRRKQAHEWLDKVSKLASQKRDENDIQFRSQVEESMSVPGTIVDYAENQKVDLIVVGSRGKSGFTRLLIGSVASKVVSYATCHVLVTK